MVAFPISKPIMLITPESHGYNSSRESEKVTVYLAIPDRTEILLGRNKGGWVLGKQPPCLLYDFSFYCVMTNPLMRWVPSLFSFFETLLDILYPLLLLFSRSVTSDSLGPHGLQQASLPCPSPFPGASSDSCPLSRWCHPLSPTSPLVLNLTQHQGHFQWVGCSHQVAKILELQFLYQPF